MIKLPKTKTLEKVDLKVIFMLSPIMLCSTIEEKLNNTSICVPYQYISDNVNLFDIESLTIDELASCILFKFISDFPEHNDVQDYISSIL